MELDIVHHFSAEQVGRAARDCYSLMDCSADCGAGWIMGEGGLTRTDVLPKDAETDSFRR